MSGKPVERALSVNPIDTRSRARSRYLESREPDAQSAEKNIYKTVKIFDHLKQAVVVQGMSFYDCIKPPEDTEPLTNSYALDDTYLLAELDRVKRLH